MYRISGSRGFGLNGLVSAVNTKSFEDPHFYGAGTTSGVVGLWDIREPYTQSLHLNAKELHNNAAAVTQVGTAHISIHVIRTPLYEKITWSNALTHMVVVGYRQHDLLHCWVRYSRRTQFCCRDVSNALKGAKCGALYSC